MSTRGSYLPTHVEFDSVDELPCNVTKLGISCQRYNDDIFTYGRGKFDKILCDIIYICSSKRTYYYYKSVGLNINFTKPT